jgi:phage terminase large subunit-like protein
MVQGNDKLVAAALRRLELLGKQESFDPNNIESRPTAKQQEVFDDFGIVKQQWIRAGNQSGKSQTCARLITWMLTNTHPTWKRPTDWGDEPLLIIVAGRTGKQIEDSLLPKLRNYLEPGSYKEVRIGNIIQRLELNTGDRVIFQSLENPSVARERLQSYVAHAVWVDELPPTMDIVRELLIRVQARNGFFLASFTPTVIAVEIQKYVDGLHLPDGKVYRFHMLDNPLYSDPIRRQELIDRYKHLPEHVQRAIFEGEWMQSEDQVYFFNWDMVEMPPQYSPLWRHVEVVDPALKSALGLTIWAECPQNGIWYCIHAEKIRGIQVPTELVTAVKERTKSYNIIRRRSDPHEVWYIQTAGSMGISYEGVYKKNERKPELIKCLQQCLGSKIRIAPHCTELIAELQECRWSDQAEGKIINASSFHLIDTAQYFADNIPKPDHNKFEARSHDEWLYKANEQRKQKILKKSNQKLRFLQAKQKNIWKRH